jgi:hypothetical protein
LFLIAIKSQIINLILIKINHFMNLALQLKNTLALAGILLAGTAGAQIVDCNAFLQGNHVEVGVSPSGSYGSSVPAPTGYHTHCTGCSGSTYNPCSGATTGTKLGFVADPAKDGWATGTPAYMGDYFLPGSPFEGWSLQIGAGTRADGWNTIAAGFTAGVTGTNISHSVAPTYVTSTWEGMYDSLKIRQVTRIDTGAAYFTMKVTFINMASTPKNDIYYFRTLDPDNDQTWPGGTFGTNNTIVRQTTDTTIVQAVGTIYSTMSSLMMGTLDTNAEAVIYDIWPPTTSVTLAGVYNHTASTLGGTQYLNGGTRHGDIAIGMTFRIPHIAPVDSAGDSIGHKTTYVKKWKHPANEQTITMFYAFSQEGLDSAMAQIARDTPTTSVITLPPTAVHNINNDANIVVYPNPVNGTLNVAGLEMADQIAVYDLLGKEVSNNWQVTTAGTNHFPTVNMPSGNYIIVVKDAGGAIKSRIPLRKQ